MNRKQPGNPEPGRFQPGATKQTEMSKGYGFPGFCYMPGCFTGVGDYSVETLFPRHLSWQHNIQNAHRIPGACLRGTN